MENEFVPYEETLALRELGFDKPCLAWYVDQKFKILDSVVLGYSSKRNNDYGTLSAPLYQQAFRWFREKHNLHGYIIPTSLGDFAPFIQTVFNKMVYDPWENINKGISYTNEEAELFCLRELIKTVKIENKLPS